MLETAERLFQPDYPTGVNRACEVARSTLPFERTLSFASGDSFEFHCRQNRWVVSEAQFLQILAFEMKSYRFTDVLRQLVQSRGLRDYREIETLRHKLVVAPTDAHLNRSFHDLQTHS